MKLTGKSLTERRGTLPSCVGLLVIPRTEALFSMIAASLEAEGVATVYRVTVPASATKGLGFSARILILVDGVLSRFLPGSRRYIVEPDLADVVELPLSSYQLPLNGQSPDIIVMVGRLSEGIADHLHDGFASLYRVCLGADEDTESGQFGLIEVLSSKPVVMLRFERCLPQCKTQLLIQMAVQTHIVSAARTKSTLVATLPEFLATALKQIDPKNSERTDKLALTQDFSPSSKADIGMSDCLRHSLRLLNAVFDRVTMRFQWLLAVMPKSEPGLNQDWDRLRPLIPPDDRFWADPFLVFREGVTWLFFEEAPFHSYKGTDVGHISVVKIDANGFAGPILRALDLPWHLSYPNVFEHEGNWYMIPESGSQKRIDLYRCSKWPDQWEYQSTLLGNYQGYDASILQEGGRYWMFAARRAEGVVTTDLLDIFCAPSPLGPWVDHPSSPVVLDVRSARPAGRPFELDGYWLRPAQDSSGGVYGRALRFQKILHIDELEYREKTVFIVEPNKAEGIHGVHSFAATDDLVVIDFCRKVSRFPLVRSFTSRLPDKLVSSEWQTDGFRE